MTKAESYIFFSKFWRFVEQRREDHKSDANVLCTIYVRSDNGVDTHRLCCYSCYGDSILWEWSKNEERWSLIGDVETRYDTALKELV